MMKLVAIRVAMVTGAMLLACGGGCFSNPGGRAGPAAERASGSGVTIPETTKILDAEASAALVSTGADGALTFSAPTPFLEALAPGDVLVAGVSNTTPYGLLRRVTAVSRDDGQFVVQTTQAKIQDAITKGRISFSADLTADDVASSELRQKGIARMELARQDEGIVLGVNDVEIYSDDNARVTASGTLAIKPHIDFDLDVSLLGAELTFGIGVGGGVNLELNATGQADFSREVPLTTLTFKPIPLPPIGPVPVVIVPQMTLYVGATGQVSAAMTAVVSHTVDLSFGVRLATDSVDPYSESSSSFDFEVPTLSAPASARAYGGVRFGRLLYGVVGPYAEVQGYLQANASLPDPSCLEWQLAAGLEANIGVDFLFDEYEANLINENTILDQSDGCGQPQQPVASWARSYSGDFDGDFSTIRATADGGYIAVGEVGLTRIMKLDGNGNIEWQKQYDSEPRFELEPAYDIWQDADGGYTVGGGVQDWSGVTKLDTAGNVVWVKRYERGGEIHSLQPVPGGGYIVTGPLFNANGDYDAWAARLDASGNVLWSRSYGGSGDDQSNVVRATPDGGFIVAGRTSSSGPSQSDSWLLKLTASGTIDWQRAYGLSSDFYPGFSEFGDERVNDVALIAAGGYYLVGDGTVVVDGYVGGLGAVQAAWVVRLDSGGDVVWAVSAAVAGDESPEVDATETGATGVVATDDGLVVAGTVGNYPEPSQAWVFKLSSMGNVSWSRIYGGPGDDRVGGYEFCSFDNSGDPLQRTTDGGFIFAGSSSSFSSELYPEPESWFVKLTNTGTVDFSASSGAQVTNVTGSFAFTDSITTAVDTSAGTTDKPLTVTDLTGIARIVVTNAGYEQQAP